MHTLCDRFIVNKKTRILLSRRIFDELKALDSRRTKKINSALLGALAKRKALSIGSLQVIDILDEVEAENRELSENDQNYIEALLSYIEIKLGKDKFVKDLIVEVRKILQISMNQFIYIEANFSPRDFALDVGLVDRIHTITQNLSDSKHLSDAFNWNREHQDNKYFVTHDAKDILHKTAAILAKMRESSPTVSLDISPIRKIIHL